MTHHSDDIITELIDTLEAGVGDFQKSIPGIQRDIFSEVIGLIKTLDIANGHITTSIKNIRTIGAIKTSLQRIILNSDYLKQVSDFINNFYVIADLQNRYFNAVSTDFNPSATLEEIKRQAIESTVSSLTESGISSNVIEPIQEILRQNITTGGTVKSFVQQMGDFIINNSSGDGAMVRYSKQITTDALNQYSAQYMQVVSDDLGFEWYEYVGSNIITSRPWCIAMTKKRYVHRSEFAEILRGNIDGKQVPIYDRTGLPAGMIPGTDEFNLTIRRGGYQCGHQFRPVPASLVPLVIRQRIAA